MKKGKIDLEQCRMNFAKLLVFPSTTFLSKIMIYYLKEPAYIISTVTRNHYTA